MTPPALKLRGTGQVSPPLPPSAPHAQSVQAEPSLGAGREGRRRGGRDGWLSAVLRCVKCLMEVGLVNQPFPHCGRSGGSSPASLMFSDIRGARQALRGFAEREGIANEAETSSPRVPLGTKRELGQAPSPARRPRRSSARAWGLLFLAARPRQDLKALQASASSSPSGGANSPTA